MTPAEIDALPAGRELDALVADKVMELLEVEREWPCYHDQDGISPLASRRSTRDGHVTKEPVYLSGRAWDPLAKQDIPGERGKLRDVAPNYSADIAAAWEVVEKLITASPRDTCVFSCDIVYGGPWGARFSSHRHGGNAAFAVGETAPLAICRAALKAVSA